MRSSASITGPVPPHGNPFVRRMLRWLVGASVGGVLIAVTLWVHLLQFSAPLQWDSHVFALIGRWWTRGYLPYRDLWEIKPPGIFMYLASVFWLLPEALYSVRFTDCVWYVAAAVAFYRVCRVEANVLIALGGTIAWLFFAHHPSFNVGGVYTEEYVAICQIAALALTIRYARRGRTSIALLGGMAAATAGLFKHPGLGVVVPMCVLLTARLRVRGVVAMAAGVIVPILVVLGFFWWEHALTEFLDCNVWALLLHRSATNPDPSRPLISLTPLLTHTREQWGPFPVLGGALVLGGIACVLQPTRLRLAALSWAVIEFAMIAVVGHYYQHHFIGLFGPTVLLGTLGLQWMLRRQPEERWYAMAPRLALLAAVGVWGAPQLRSMVINRQPYVEHEWTVLRSGPSAWRSDPAQPFEARIGTYLRERTRPDDRIHVHAWGGSVLGIYWTADRPMASRYFYAIPFGGLIDAERQVAELRLNKPEYVVISNQPPVLPLTPWLLENYTVEPAKKDPSVEGSLTEIWVRTRRQPWEAGTGIDVSLHGAAGRSALTLPAQAAVGAGAVRRGTWTSPVLPVRGDDGRVPIDWSPRSDLAWNARGVGFPRIDALPPSPNLDPRSMLGMVSPVGYWTGVPAPEGNRLTVQFGFPAVADRVVLATAEAATSPPADIEVQTSLAEVPHERDDGFRPVAGHWEQAADGGRTYQFERQALSAVRLRFRPGASGNALPLRRISVPAVGMGVVVRYRTGKTTNLDGADWSALPEDAAVPTAMVDGFVQVQFELWSADREFSPVLRFAQIGRECFGEP